MVREFLYDNPTASMEELLAVDEEIRPGDIERWLREGRLLISKGSTLLKCGRCGKAISGGRVCLDCSHAVSSMYAPDKTTFQTAEDRTGKMRVGDRK
jgi:ribosomal protein L32